MLGFSLMSSPTDSFAVVTGGAGFVGSHLCDALIVRGERVVCLDNLFTGSKKNIEHLLPHRDFQFIQCDINHLPSPSDHPSLHRWKLHMIYHLACPASPVHYQIHPVQTVRTNVVGTINMLDFALAREVPLLLASTSEVYGDPEVHPQPETYVGHVDPLGPRACYDEGKRCAETLCREFSRQYGLPTKIARIFNTYGPRMALDDGRVVSNFITQALLNAPITVYGNGSHTRSFQYVDDLIQGLLSLARKENFEGPVNIGTPYEMTIKQLAELIVKLTKSKSEIVFKPEPEVVSGLSGPMGKVTYKPLPKYDPKQRRPDISLAKKELGWEPKVSVEEGLNKTIEYFRSGL